ncbi:hypothetical protein HK101_009416 [Irineochytrium annulatum]|nr:hypothetical protein HK101_009416 [Irineochytrium annulatum]
MADHFNGPPPAASQAALAPKAVAPRPLKPIAPAPAAPSRPSHISHASSNSSKDHGPAKTPRCGLCKRTDVDCTYVRRFVTPTLIRGKHTERNDQINENLSKTLRKRVHELEKTRPNVTRVESLMSELSQAKCALEQRDSPVIPVAESPNALSQSSGSPRSGSGSGSGSGSDVGAFMGEEMLLNLAFPELPATNQEISQDPNATQPLVQRPINSDRGAMWDRPRPPESESTRLEEAINAISFINAPVSSANAAPPWINAIEEAYQQSHLEVDAGISISYSGRDPSKPDRPLFTSDIFASEAERDALLQAFFDMEGRFICPVIHEGYFWRKLRGPSPPTRCLVLAMCAIGASATAAEDGSLWPVNVFANPGKSPRAEALMNAAVLSLNLEDPAICTCQALVLMILLQTSMTDPQTSQEWLLGGMAMRIVPILKLDVDPDVLERLDPSGVPWQWVEKEMRRRLFAVICMIDELDMIFRESCFGIWKRKHNVKGPNVAAVWRSVDAQTGEPMIDYTKVQPCDASRLTLSIINLRCRISELNTALGMGYGDIKRLITTRPANTSDENPALASTLDVSPELQFALLDAELGAWLKTMPPSFHPQTLANEVSFHCLYDTSRGPDRCPTNPPFAALRLHLLYMAGALALHRPRVVRELRALAAHHLREGTTDPAMLTLTDGCRDSLRKCAKAAVGITQLMRRKVIISYPSPQPSRLRPFACYLQLAAGYAMPLLEAGLINTLFLFFLGVHAAPDDYHLMGPPAMRVKLKELVGEIVGGDSFQMAALEGLAAASQVLNGLARRKQVAVMAETLERVIKRLGIEGLLKTIPQVVTDNDFNFE